MSVNMRDALLNAIILSGEENNVGRENMLVCVCLFCFVIVVIHVIDVIHVIHMFFTCASCYKTESSELCNQISHQDTTLSPLLFHFS